MGIEINAYPTFGNNVKTVTTAGTRVNFPAAVTKSVTLKAFETNTGIIYVGTSTVSSSNGFRLLAEDSLSLDVSMLDQIWIDSSVSGEGVSYVYLTGTY